MLTQRKRRGSGKVVAVLAACSFVPAAGGAAAAAPAWAPEKNVEIVAGTSAGSGMDNTARVIQRILRDKKIVVSPLTVVNKPGGAGTISWNYVVQHAGDGHYVAIGTFNLITNRITGSSPLTYTDVTPLALLYNEYMAFTVKADSPFRTGKDLVERIKQSPGAVSFGISLGPGNVTHLAATTLMKAAGGEPKQLKIVVFPSGVESLTAVLGGHIDVAMTSPPVVIGQRRAGNVRIIGIAAPRRLGGTLPDVPTWKEQGYNAVVTNWRSVVGPKGMSQPQIDFWDGAFAKLVETGEWKRDLEKNFWDGNYLDSQATRAYFAQQHDELRALLVDLGLAK